MNAWIYENSVKEIAPYLCVCFFSFFALDTINKADVILRMPVFFISTHLSSFCFLAWSDLKAFKSNLVQRIDMFFINPVIYLFTSNYYS